MDAPYAVRALVSRFTIMCINKNLYVPFSSYIKYVRWTMLVYCGGICIMSINLHTVRTLRWISPSRGQQEEKMTGRKMLETAYCLRQSHIL